MSEEKEEQPQEQEEAPKRNGIANGNPEPRREDEEETK